MTTELVTHNIPTENMERLVAKLAQLNRRAVKLGCPEVKLEVIREYSRIAPGYEQDAKRFGEDKVPKQQYAEITIHGEGPKVDGWKFVGTLDHYTIPGSVIVKTVPSETIPSQFHCGSATCSHCNKIRNRSETFVLEGIDANVGQWKQVGRNCLKDFFGHDPSRIANFLSYIFSVVDELAGGEYGQSSGSREQYCFSHIAILKATVAIIRNSGWVSRATSDNTDRLATADLVLQTFFPPRHGVEREQWNEWMKELNVDSEANEIEAIAARTWLKQQPNVGEYMHNLHTIDQADAVPVRLIGYWCSIVASYQREQERNRLRNAITPLNEHFGNIKDRVEINTTITNIQRIDGSYGYVDIVRMQDDAGRTLVWFANCRIDMSVGSQYKIKATIKKHDKYKDINQTVLTRVVVIS